MPPACAAVGAPRFGYRPSRRSTCLRSAPVTSAPRPRRRVRRLDFFSSRCERNALRRPILPDPRTWERLAAPRCVFIFCITPLPRRRSPPGAALLLLVLVPAVVHDPAHRWIGVRRNLDEIELFLTGDRERLRQRLDPELLAPGSDEQDLAGPNPVVDPGVVCGYVITSLIALLNWVRCPASIRPGTPGREDGGLGKSAIARPLGRP